MYANFSSQVYQDLKFKGVLAQNLKFFSMPDKLVCWAVMFT